MHLVSLSANNSTFKTVEFKNETGLNFIVASQKEVESSHNTGKTYNGVGKSLIIALIDFCLGSSVKSDLEAKLPGWEFTLKFKIDGKLHSSTRRVNEQSIIVFDNKKIKSSQFTTIMGTLVFDIPDNIKFLSFRNLISFFLRPNRKSYASYDNPKSLNQQYQILVLNSFLLGLDVSLVQAKYDLKQAKDKINDMLKALKKDTTLQDYFLGKKNASLEVKEIDLKIKKLKRDLESFNIAADYYDIKNEADDIKNQLDVYQNQAVIFKKQISNIEESLELKANITLSTMQKVYEDAKVVFKEDALKTFEELQKFYDFISSSRISRLLRQKNHINSSLKEIEINIDGLKRDFNSKLQFLNTHQSLDVYTQVVHQLAELQNERENIEKFRELRKTYTDNKKNIEDELRKLEIQTENYLVQMKDEIDKATDLFREIAKKIYPNATSGIVMESNEGDNQLRFKIQAQLHSDASDGISNVKIFCYDLTLLFLEHCHKIGFIFHDSRLISDIDPRQSAQMFRILNSFFTDSNKQYILSLNQNQLEEIKQILTHDEYREIIEANICLELKDEPVSGKLLGRQIDLHYD